MGFFNELGRRVETFKRTAKDAAEEHADYQCRACEERFDTEHEQCPECGGDLVTATS